MDFRITDAPRNAKRVQLLIDDEPVSGLYILDLPMRIGSVTMRMGGIGGVATPEKHRMKGYSRAVMDFSVEYMVRERYDMSVLFGIPNYYHKWGFIESLAHQECTIRVDSSGCPGALCEVRGKHRLRTMRVADIPSVLRIYHADNALRSGTILRDPDKWRRPRIGSRWEIKPKVLVACEGHEVVGYMFVDDVKDTVACTEAAALHDSVFHSLAAYLARRAKAIGAETVRVLAPADHPFAMYLRRFGATFTQSYPLCRGGMARIENFEVLMSQLGPEFTRRAKEAGARAGAVCIVTDIGAAVVHWDGRRARVTVGEAKAQGTVRTRQEVLSQMLLGYRGWRDAANDDRVVISGRPGALGEALFPQGNPYMWAADHF